MTETREFDEVRARLQRFDLGPLPDIDLDDVVRRGHSQRRRALAERVLAVAAVAALVAGVAVAVPHLGREPEPPVVVSPTPTPTSTGAPTPTPTDPSPTPTESTQAPISVPVLEESVPQPLGAGQGPVAVAMAVGGDGDVIWAITSTGAGKAGHLLSAEGPELPGLRVRADVGTYPTDLAVSSSRVWVVNDVADPRDKAYRAGTVDEFDRAGRLLHEYRVAASVPFGIAADGDDAYLLVGGDAGSVRVRHLHAGSAATVAVVTPRADTSWISLAQTTDHRLWIQGFDTAANAERLWTVDPGSGAVSEPLLLPFDSWTAGRSIAAHGTRVVVIGNPGEGPGRPTVVMVDAGGVHQLAGCPSWPRSVTASGDGAWLASDPNAGTGTADVGTSVQPVTETACGLGLRLPDDRSSNPVIGEWASGAWVLSSTHLYGVVLTDRPDLSPPTRGSSASILAPSESDTPAAGVCPVDTDDIVTFTLSPDVPSPRCLQLTGRQKVRIVNPSPGGAVTVAIGGTEPRVVDEGGSTTYDATLGTFLAPGVHGIRTSDYGGGGPEIWLR